MSVDRASRPIKIFTPSYADEEDSNAQNLTVKEIIARLPEQLFHVTMLHLRAPDPRIAGRRNTRLLPHHSRGNAALWLAGVVASQPDIYFYPRQGSLDSAVFTLRKLGLLKAAIVAHIVMVMNRQTMGGLIGRSIRESDAVFANSSYVAETVRQQFAVQPQVIFNGIDRRFFFPPEKGAQARGAESLSALYAGSFQPRKRVEFVIELAARWPQVGFRLAGRGETEPACRQLAQERGCRNVVFLGQRSLAELGEEMRRSDVFLFPSILEGHPQVLGQAAACGLPAIAMNLYRPEYVVNGETGFLVESEADFTQKLELLLCDSARRQSMAAAAVRHSQKFDWDQIARQWAEVFQRLARS